jgi:hypothetical protein
VIARIRLAAQLITVVGVLWILGAIIWGLLARKHQIETPMLAVWLVLGAALVRLVFWAVSKAASRP